MTSPASGSDVTATNVLRRPWAQARCLRAVDVGLRLVPGAPDPAAIADRARRAGQLLAAWDGERDCYPAFQWDAQGCLHARIADLLAVLPRERDGSLGADAVLWMWQPDDALDGRDPATVFYEDPERVITLARRRRDGGDDAN